MLTGKDVVLAAKKDLESLFVPNANFELKVELDSSSRHHASVVGKGENLRVRLSKDFCLADVSDIDSFHYFALIIGHEIAHYMHAHNEHDDETEYDSKSIEAFTDFFGTRVMMTLITYGQEHIEIYNKLGFEFHSGKVIDSIGMAISELSDSLFKADSRNYPNCISRVGFCAAGVTSFLDKKFGDVKIQRSMDVLTRIYTAGSLPQLFTLESDDFDMDPNLIVRSDEVHKVIQGIQLSICHGVQPQYFKYIGTSYHSTEASREMYVETIRSMAKEQGYDLPKLT
ncbi:hypothetical protein [Photobacterium leiognathi]|uniref:hypothetical protein n=1 Tax=Photobacterium leiognathi TaxID=553611 RepID=UPI003DA136DB